MELWRDVPGYPGYQVSSEGRVKSLRRKAPKILTPMLKKTDKFAYPHLHLMKDGKTIYAMIHRVVALAFLGPCPSPDHEVAHINGDRLDYKLANLAWKTRLENAQDQIDHGTQVRGEKVGNAKLTVEIVREIKATSGVSSRQLAIKYDVSPSAIEDIRKGKTWRHA